LFFKEPFFCIFAVVNSKKRFEGKVMAEEKAFDVVALGELL
jgi:hypothetical protein